MERRKVLKVAAGTAAAMVGVAGAGYVVLDRIFNPKTPLAYAFPEINKGNGLLTATPECGEAATQTLPQTEGPYYSRNTPQRNNLIEPDTVGIPLIIEGYVVDQQCKPVTGAVLDFWSCDGNGIYDNDGMKLRGHQFTDANGYYRLDTVRPAFYEAGPFAIRTAHIHVKVQGEKTALLTTQLYFPNEQLNAEDSIFNPALLLTMLNEKSIPQQARFNFVLT